MKRHLSGVAAGIVTFILLEVVFSYATALLAWTFWALVVVVGLILMIRARPARWRRR